MNHPHHDFATADLIDIAPESPSCQLQFQRYGQRQRFCGRVRTVRCFQDNGLVKQILNTPSDGEVLVVDAGGSMYSAIVGDQIAEAARQNGWAGVIVNGPIRDSAVINQMDFGIKALGTNPKKSGKSGCGDQNVTIAFGRVAFHPGDYVYSDEDGILVVAEPIAAK